MKRMMIPLVLLGGLTLAGSVLAADAAAQVTGMAANASKVAIDPVTGKRRPITQAESRALDAQAANQLRTAQRSGKSKGGIRFPASQGESVANAKTVNGITGFKPTADMLSSITATIGADGKVVVSEDGQPATNAQELPNE